MARSKHITPLRYPGGKKWFIRHAEAFVLAQRPKLLIEAFAGGATVGLTLLHRNLIGHLVMVERDPRVAAFWRKALTDPSFAEQVETFECTTERVEAVIADTSTENRALWALVKNRCSFGGNLSGGLMRDVAARWNGQKLSTTLRLIHSLAERITFVEGDGVKVLQDYSHRQDAVAFCDPPYSAETTSAGHKLYQHSKVDHQALFHVLGEWVGRWIATYDDNNTIRKILRDHGLAARGVKMRTNHRKTKYELVIGRDLSWMSQEESIPLGQIERGELLPEPATTEKRASPPYIRSTFARDGASESDRLTSAAGTKPCTSSTCRAYSHRRRLIKSGPRSASGLSLKTTNVSRTRALGRGNANWFLKSGGARARIGVEMWILRAQDDLGAQYLQTNLSTRTRAGPG
jgi:DNA adenine methylase